MRALVHEYHVDPDIVNLDEEGGTPVYKASEEGHAGAVRCLCEELGASPRKAT